MTDLTYRFTPSADFAQNTGKDSFLFQHNLSGTELFTRASLKKLVNTIGALRTKTSYRGGKLSPGFFIKKGVGNLEWGTPEFQRALDEAYDNIDFAGARIKLTDIQQVPEYAAMLATCITSLSEVTGIDFQRDFNRAIATLFITSPGELTPYHIDQEVNFLLQIEGAKHVQLFNGNDRSVVTPGDLEAFWSGTSFIQQNPESTPKSYTMGANQGVHQPPFFPHIIKVGDHMSVSLSLGFRKARFPEAEVYRANAYLRKLGLHPNPPGSNRALDTLKSAVIRPALHAKETLFGTNGVPLSTLRRAS